MGAHNNQIAVSFFSVLYNFLDRISPFHNDLIGDKARAFLRLLYIFTELMQGFFDGQMISPFADQGLFGLIHLLGFNFLPAILVRI